MNDYEWLAVLAGVAGFLSSVVAYWFGWRSGVKTGWDNGRDSGYGAGYRDGNRHSRRRPDHLEVSPLSKAARDKEEEDQLTREMRLSSQLAAENFRRAFPSVIVDPNTCSPEQLIKFSKETD